jgi:flagellar biosynthesis protein
VVNFNRAACLPLIRRYSIKGKGKIASAIAYTAGDAAPRLIVKGRNWEAEKIIAQAREAGIMVMEDPALAALLDAGLNSGDYIPPWCWEAVARILALVFEKESR